jgi:small subunit ribosomal protein S3
MGQKVNPIGIRTGSFLPWKSRWFADQLTFKDFLVEDIKIRKGLMKRLVAAGITSVEIERQPKTIVLIITVSRPGVVIGRGGTGIEDVKKFVVSVMSAEHKKNIKDLKIDGTDVMQELNLKPGPEIGKILTAIFAEVEEGKLKNEREVLVERLKLFKIN